MKIILDCDPGHDDAVALMLLGSSPLFDVLGVTTVSGNQSIEKTTKNALDVLNYLGLPFKVYRGSARPLKKEPAFCAAIHGESGLDGFVFPECPRKAEPTDAVSFMIDAIGSLDEKVTLVTTGPMTNAARALLRAPQIARNIEKIVLMGGSIGAGNVTPAAEFNIHCDPEAADVCFRSGLPVYMVGLDVTRRALVTPEIIESTEKIGGRAAVLFSALMKTFLENQRKVFGLEGAPLHDPVTLAWLLEPSLLHFEYVHTEIDTDGGISYGRTNCDLPGYLKKEKNSYAATGINVDLFFDVVKNAVAHYRDQP